MEHATGGRTSIRFFLSTSIAICIVLTSCTHDRIRSAGRTRHYVLHVPEAVAASDRPAPFILAFHGAGGSATGMRDHTHLEAEADRRGYIVAFLEGSGVYRNWGDSEGADLQFVRDLIERLRRELPIDPDRVYAVGFSSGGRFAQRLACDPSIRIAAFVSVSSTLDRPAATACAAVRSVSSMLMLGTDDPSVRWEAAGRPEPTVSLTAEETVEHWAQRNGCSLAPSVSELRGAPEGGSPVERREYSGCRAGRAVLLYVLHGQGHAWPRVVRTLGTDTLTAGGLIAEFLESTNR